MKKFYTLLLSLLCFGFVFNTQAAKDSSGRYSVDWTYKVSGSTVYATPNTNGKPPCLKVRWRNSSGTTYSNSWSLTQSFNAPGTYTICCNFWDSCQKWDTTICKQVTIQGSTTGYCDSVTPRIESKKDCKKMQFWAVPVGLTNASYSWDFGDGSTGTGRDPKHTYMKEGWYSVCVTISFTNPAGTVKCSKRVCTQVWVGCGQPCALTGEYGYKIDNNGNVKFVGNSNTGFWYLWTFGDGKTAYGKDPSHTFSKPGTYNVCLTIYTLNFRCKVTICKTVVIPEPCKVSGGFTASLLQGNTFKFKASSVGGYAYEWSFGDGSTGTGMDPTHTYAKPGVYEVCLKIWGKDKKCYIYVCKKIEIKATTKCSLSKLNITGYLSSKCLTITGEAPLLSSLPCAKYSWYLYGTNTVFNGRVFTYTPSAEGTYKFCLIVSDTCNKCDTIICKEITIKKCDAPCKWDNTKVSYQNVCNKYYFNAPYYQDSCIKYSWTFDKLGTGTGATPSYTFPDSKDTITYAVCVKLTNTCKRCDTTICLNVKVIPCAKKCSWTGAGFSASANCRVVNFEATNLSKTCLQYSYKYSTASNTTYTSMLTTTNRLAEFKFPQKGTYNVCLNIRDTCNKCDTTICKTVTISCDSCTTLAYFSVDSISASGKLYVTNYSKNASYYYWSFGDSTYSADKTPGKSYSAGGTYVICLRAYDANKTCFTTICKTIKFTKTREATAYDYLASGASMHVNIAPNPANSAVLINTDAISTQVFVTDLSGKLVYSGSTANGRLSINTSIWKEGIYMVKVQSALGSNTQKLLITH